MKINIDGKIYRGSAKDIVARLRLESPFIGAKTDDEFISDVTSRLPTLAQQWVSANSLTRAEEFIGALVSSGIAIRMDD